MQLSRLLISLPLVALALSPRLSWAAATPVEALELLVKAKTVDAKCRSLDDAARQELSRYTARAEVAVSQTVPLSDVEDTIANGRTLGNSTACDDAAKGEVAATLAAARRAVAIADAGRNERQRVRETPIPDSALASNDRPASQGRLPAGDLETYGREAMAYYVERRCTYLASHRTQDFYNQIVRRHQAAIRAYGGPAVSAVLRRSEADANDVSCGQGRELVASAYDEIRR